MTVIDTQDLLFKAVRAIATACDGAEKKDGQGFNSYDRDFGHDLAVSNPATWSPRKRRSAWKMMKKYRGQLLAHGISFDLITEPAEVLAGPPTGPSQAEVESVHRAAFPPVRRLVLRSDDKFGIVFRDADAGKWTMIRDGVKRIPGAQFEATTKSWTIPRAPHVLEHLIPFLQSNGFTGTPEIHAEVQRLQAKVEETKENVEASRATDADIVIPGLGGELRPFQRAGAAYGMKNERVLIGDEMGLGKTVQGLAILQGLQAFPTIVMCPATLKVNWYREACKWLPGKRVTIWDSRGGWPADIVIINYDVIGRVKERLIALKAQGVIGDESHYLKNRKAKRTEAAKEIMEGVRVRLLLSGTPILNRPNELVTQLELLGRIEEFGGYFQFVKRYCQAMKSEFGLDTGGADHLQELNHRLRATCFIRRMKADVLKELPSKQRSVVPLDISNREEYSRAEKELLEWIREQALKKAEGDVDLFDSQERREEFADQAVERAAQAEQLVRIEALKKLAARGKMDGVTSWVEDFLESGEKLVIFAHHVDIVQELARRFNAPAIYGDVPLATRQQMVDRFQQDPNCKVFVLNLASGGVGLTLTASSNVAFVELGWTPGIHDQAEDRCHRIGQTDQVTAWYLLAERTIDEDIQELIAKKRAVVDAAIDGKMVEQSIGMEDLIEKMKSR